MIKTIWALHGILCLDPSVQSIRHSKALAKEMHGINFTRVRDQLYSLIKGTKSTDQLANKTLYRSTKEKISVTPLPALITKPWYSFLKIFDALVRDYRPSAAFPELSEPTPSTSSSGRRPQNPRILDGQNWPHWFDEKNGNSLEHKHTVIRKKISDGASYDEVFNEAVEFQNMINTTLKNIRNSNNPREPPISKLCKSITKTLGDKRIVGKKRKGKIPFVEIRRIQLARTLGC